MTREEAKEIFLNRGFVNGIFDGDKWRQSIVVISKWLEQEPCDDYIKIPEGATNGNMIKAMFPKARFYESENFVQFWYSEMEDGRHINFRRTWWNSQYRKEQE